MATPNGSVRPAISFPALEGMMYPRLEGLVRVVADAAALLKLRAEELSAVRVLMTSATNGCNSAMLAAMPSLGLIVSQGIGADRFDTAALAARGIRLRLVGEATDDVADLAMTLLNMIGRGLVRGDVFARSGAWQRGRFEVGESLVGKTIGIGGLSGRIGQAIARRAVVSRMTVAGLRRKSNEGLVATLHDDWAALAAASDILVLAMSASPETRHVIGAAELKALGPKGYLVNVGAGRACRHAGHDRGSRAEADCRRCPRRPGRRAGDPAPSCSPGERRLQSSRRWWHARRPKPSRQGRRG